MKPCKDCIGTCIDGDCKLMEVYQQGREDAIAEVEDKTLREAVVKTSIELIQKFAEKGNWKQVKREAVSLAEITCGWTWADELAEQMKEQKNG